ncbi:DUF4865 family protein [Mesorhizobium silamurunense]|uniref:DUF4865 family protein n=1 Tax=Mesorhizobium silamurunense TaxID=499528 RepID=UPI00177B8B18
MANASLRTRWPSWRERRGHSANYPPGEVVHGHGAGAHSRPWRRHLDAFERHALRSSRSLFPGAPRTRRCLPICRRGEKLRSHPDVHTAALALDAQRWQIIQFVAWNIPPQDDEMAERYEILHTSTPDIDALPKGRGW